MSKKYIIFIAVLILSHDLFSQKPWTLEACINYAVQNNLNIKQQELNVNVSENNKFQSYSTLLPSINGYASHSYNYGLTVDRYTNQFANTRVQSDNMYLNGSFTIFNGFQNINSIKKSKVELDISKNDVSKLINDISLSIATAYVQILYNSEIMKTAENQLDITRQQLEKNRKMFEAGTIARFNLLSIEAQAANDELNLVNAKNALDISYLILKQLLDLPADQAFEIDKPNVEITGEEVLSVKTDDIYNIALTNQPDIKSAALKIQSTAYELSIARGTRSPQIFLQGSIGTGFSGASQRVKGYDTLIYTIGYTKQSPPTEVIGTAFSPVFEKTPFSNQISDNVNKTIGLGISIPILNSLQTYTNISKTKLALKNAEYNLQITKNNLNKTIQQAYADAKAAFNKYNATKKSLEALAESYKYAEERYNVGLLNYVDFNDSKSKFVKAQSELLQSKYDYIFRTKVLDFYMGKALY